jgi:hypothetical protein
MHTKWNCTTAPVIIIANMTADAGRAHQKIFLIVRLWHCEGPVACNVRSSTALIKGFLVSTFVNCH